MMRSGIIAAAALGLQACASSYVFRPSENATAKVAGQVAADYQVPPDQPQGDVRVASFGVTQVKAEGSDEKLRALHLRMVVADNGHQPWVVDTRQQYLQIEGGGTSRAAYAWADQGTLPLVQVPAGGKRTIDLFYPLPVGMQKASKIPQFDAVWTVQAGQRLVRERTPFERLKIEPVYAYGYPYGWGYWGWPYAGDPWYDPFFSSAGYVAVPVPQRFTEHPVSIAQPTWR